MTTAPEPFRIIRPVLPTELASTRQMLVWLKESMDDDPLTLSLEELVDEILAKRSILWTWGTGILLTTIRFMGGHIVCELTNVRGNGYLENIEAIDHDIESYAKFAGARYIIGEVPHPGLMKTYLRRGARLYPRMLREVK